MDEEKRKEIPYGSIYRVVKTHLDEKEKGISKDATIALKKCVEKYIFELVIASAEVAEQHNRKTVSFEHLKEAGEKLGILVE